MQSEAGLRIEKKDTMDKKYILHIAESKVKYHKRQAKMSYEEKFRIVLELQKIDSEMRKDNKLKDATNFHHRSGFVRYKVWQPEGIVD